VQETARSTQVAVQAKQSNGRSEPNMQRSLPVLSQTVGSAGQCRQFNQLFAADGGNVNSPMFAGGPSQHDLSAAANVATVPTEQALVWKPPLLRQGFSHLESRRFFFVSFKED